MNQNLISKNESKPHLQTQKTRTIKHSKKKNDLSNEILYFSINQDSK